MLADGLYTVGLCGGSGAGKGYVGKSFEALGYPVIDTDAVYRSLTDGRGEKDCMEALKLEFGDGIADENGALRRDMLSALVFAPGGEKKRAALNAISHKYILHETRRIAEGLKKSGAAAVIIDAPLLFESGFDRFCELTVCVTAPTDVRIKRICERDGISIEAARMRIASQLTDGELAAQCDEVIINDNSRNIEEQVLGIIKKRLAAADGRGPLEI